MDYADMLKLTPLEEMDVKSGQLLALRLSGTAVVCGYFLIAKVDTANKCVKGLMYWQGPNVNEPVQTLITSRRLEPFCDPMREEFACHVDGDELHNVVARYADRADIDRFTFLMRDTLLAF